MEKDDINNLFEIFKPYLKNNMWSKFFYVSLLGNLWYDKIDNILFSLDPYHLDYTHWYIADKMVDWKKKNLLIDDKSLDFYIFLQEQKLKNNFQDGYISSCISDTEEFKRFEVLPYNDENLKYIKSLLIDNKINKIIK
jgi:hypothetical protein